MSSKMAVPLALVFLLTLMAFAPCLAADEPAAKDAAVFLLKHASPLYMMRLLGLLSTENFTAGKATTWYRSSAVAEEPKLSPLLPTGIDIVAPYEPDNSLIIYGTQESIDKLRKVVAMLDIAPKQVQVKGEFYRLPLDRAKQLGHVADQSVDLTGISVYIDSKGLIRSALKELKDWKANLIGAPVLTTNNNQPGRISISQQVPYEIKTSTVNANGQVVEETKTQSTNVAITLNVTPRVNGDGTITLAIEASAHANPPSAQAELLKTQRRVADGESLIIMGPPGDPDVLVLVVTPTVIN